MERDNFSAMKSRKKEILTETYFEELRGVLAENIRELRGRRRLSQEDLALEAGVDRTMVSKIERMITNPSLGVLTKLSVALDVPVSRLLQETTSWKSTRNGSSH